MTQTIYDVKEGAKLSCSLGSSSSNLKVPNSHGVCIQGQNQAVISDNAGNVNIMPFGMCKRSNPPVPCTPTIVMKWLYGNKGHMIRGELVLLNICIVPCVFGGIIKIDQSGQKV
jgi:hypothetical protein